MAEILPIWCKKKTNNQSIILLELNMEMVYNGTCRFLLFHEILFA